MFTALKKHLIEEEGLEHTNKVHTVCLQTSFSPADSIWPYLPPWNFVVTNEESAKFILQNGITNGRLIYKIVRQGVVFGQVRER